MPSLADLLQESEAQRFAGRRREMAALGELLDADSGIRIAFVHGSGGSGKSMLVGELARRASQRGFAVRMVDGRRLDRAPATLERALGAIDPTQPTLILIDTYEQISSLDGHLREHLLPGLPSDVRVVVAGRHPPDPAWSRSGWNAIAVEVALGPLPDADARELVLKRGIVDPELASALVRWGGGEPLPISLACEAARRDPDFRPESLDGDSQLIERMIRQICDGELDGLGSEVMLTAAVARFVDPEILEEVVGVTDGSTAEAWLGELSFSERIGGRLTLHERVRQALRVQARSRDPLALDNVRRRLADHLYRRALTGEPELVAELTALIENPVLKLGFDGGEVHLADRLRDGDVEMIEGNLANGTPVAWWKGVRRWLVEAPEHVIVARDDHGNLAGFTIAVTPANAPDWADQDRVLGRWLADARERSPEGNALIWRDTFVFSTGPVAKSAGAAHRPVAESAGAAHQARRPDVTGESEVVALLNAAATVSCGLDNPRWFYGPVPEGDAKAQALSEAMGALHLPSLDVQDGERRIQCHRFDHGPGGIIATAHAMVVRELGLAPAGLDLEGSGQPPVAFPSVEAARWVLRNFHRPDRLALSPLAEGVAEIDRAKSLRRRVLSALDSAFGDSAHDRLLRETLERGYLDPDGNHARAALEIHLSRSTYFRRLREATARLAAARLKA